jgi:nucleoid DNA-binding protein
MATAKKSPASAKKAPSRAMAKPAAKAAAAPMKPIKEMFGRTALVAHLAAEADTEPKVVKKVMAALEATMLASIHKKGAGGFTLPGLLKISAVQVPAKKKRRGIDPFTKEEREFAAKPASVKLRVRSLKKLKDAAL